jgi:hypothetical protein
VVAVTEYVHLYVHGPEDASVETYWRRLENEARAAGLEVYNSSELKPIPKEVVEAATDGAQPENALHNWVLKVLPRDTVGLWGRKLRLQDQERVADVIQAAGPPGDGAAVDIRSRVAGFTGGADEPFSYDPGLDYYTEPEGDSR